MQYVYGVNEKLLSLEMSRLFRIYFVHSIIPPVLPSTDVQSIREWCGLRPGT